MTSFIRELYDCEISEVNKKFKFSDIAEEAYAARGKLYKKLTEKLNKDALDLFEKYLDEDHTVRDEEIFHAYRCGMKDLLRLFISVFDEQ